ncbi:MAG: hypothetical protein AB1352_04725 [Patescibacteria group bacterium]
MERKKRAKKTQHILTLSCILILILLSTLLIISSIQKREYLPFPSLPPSNPQHTSQGIRASELRGRRGIIIDATSEKLTIKPTDDYAPKGTLLTIVLKPLTTFVRITIPMTPQPEKAAVERTPTTFVDLQRGDDVFVISFSDITASTSFSALRVEKITTP